MFCMLIAQFNWLYGSLLALTTANVLRELYFDTALGVIQQQRDSIYVWGNTFHSTSPQLGTISSTVAWF